MNKSQSVCDGYNSCSHIHSLLLHSWFKPKTIAQCFCRQLWMMHLALIQHMHPKLPSLPGFYFVPLNCLHMNAAKILSNLHFSLYSCIKSYPTYFSNILYNLKMFSLLYVKLANYHPALKCFTLQSLFEHFF